MKKTIKTHLVSQIILKQFTDSKHHLVVHSKGSGAVSRVTTGKTAYVEIDRVVIEELERRWSNDVETHAAKTLNVLNNGDVLVNQKHINMIKKILALHFVRSAALMLLLARSTKIYKQQIINNLAKDHPESIESIKSQVEQNWPRLALETLPAILDENIQKVEDFMGKHGLEVGLAPEGSSFIIGDNPAITMDKDGRMGVLAGVPITECNSFAMPITPRHLVALKTDPETTKYIQLTASEVDAANNKQIQHSLREYYSKPE